MKAKKQVGSIRVEQIIVYRKSRDVVLLFCRKETSVVHDTRKWVSSGEANPLVEANVQTCQINPSLVWNSSTPFPDSCCLHVPCCSRTYVTRRRCGIEGRNFVMLVFPINFTNYQMTWIEKTCPRVIVVEISGIWKHYPWRTAFT